MGKPLSRSRTKSKAEQKFEKKIQFYDRVGETIATLNARNIITKKKKLRRRKREWEAFDLSALSESLPELEASGLSSAAKLKINCKYRLKFILKELKQMVRVLCHPEFQADPLGSIQQHLESTQPVEEQKKKKKNINGSKKRKENLKAFSRPSSMEM